MYRSLHAPCCLSLHQGPRISSLTKTKHKVHTAEDLPAGDKDGDGDKLEMQDEDDIDISLEIKAAADDIEAMASTASVTFEPGDIFGEALGICQSSAHVK
jgi:hypothetical protein